MFPCENWWLWSILLNKGYLQTQTAEGKEQNFVEVEPSNVKKFMKLMVISLSPNFSDSQPSVQSALIFYGSCIEEVIYFSYKNYSTYLFSQYITWSIAWFKTMQNDFDSFFSGVLRNRVINVNVSFNADAQLKYMIFIHVHNFLLTNRLSQPL